MKILQVVPSYLPAARYGGPVFAVHGLARALVGRGHEVHVFTTNIDGDGTLPGPTGRPRLLDGVAVHYFAVRRPRRLFRAPEMREALRREVADFAAVHLHSLFLWPTWAAAREAARAGTPYFVSPRGMLVRDLVRQRGRIRKELWLRLFERRTLERARGLVMTSDLEAREANAFGLRLPPVHVIPNGVDPEAYAGAAPGQLPPPASACAGRTPYLLFLGRISWKKGLDRLVAALPGIPTQTLVVAGPDDEGLSPGLEAAARRLGIEDRVMFVGPVDEPAKAALLRGASLLVLPSLSENFGNVVIEALAAGCPVAVSAGVGMAEVVRAEGAGRIVPGEPEAMGRALAALLADEPALASMRRAGPAVVQARFAWPDIAARMEAVYAGRLPVEGS